jgi:opacity protein-like surface antigen
MKSKIIMIWTALLIASAYAQVKMQPHLYVGAGMIRPLIQTDPDISAETEIEQNYYVVNDNTGARIKAHGQVRLGLIEAGPFSAGYTFWSYRREYENDYPQVWATEFKQYPLRFDYSLHAGYLQVDLKAMTIQKLRAVPYLTAGLGAYFGSTKKVDYLLSSPDDLIYSRETETEKYDGWAWMAGFGYVIIKRIYIQFEVVDLRQKHLPAQRLFDVVVGVRI